MVKVVFLCKGTRGDVLPLLSIAIAYKHEHNTDDVVAVCAASSIAGVEESLAQEGIEIISSLPEVVVSTDAAKLQLLKHEASICYQACNSSHLVVFNLFSLEGYFIAQELSVPCIATSPFLLTRTPPTGFKEKLSQELPDLFQALTSSSTSGEVVSYAEVDHWMWRLFLDDYGSVCNHLALSSNTPLLSEASLPPPITLLYGISSVLTPRQPYWPKSVRLCGYWYSSPVLQDPPPAGLSTMVEQFTKPLVYIGFGSMEGFMLDVNWATLLTMLDTALKEVNMEGIFQCKENGPIQKTFDKLSKKLQHLRLWNSVAPHQWLFHKCVAILHHGGSGTVATSLLAKRPQLICPVMFDQEHWAEIVVWKSLGIRLTPANNLTVKELRAKLTLVVTSTEITDSIDFVYTEIVKEDGVKNALLEIDKILYK